MAGTSQHDQMAASLCSTAPALAHRGKYARGSVSTTGAEGYRCVTTACSGRPLSDGREGSHDPDVAGIAGPHSKQVLSRAGVQRGPSASVHFRITSERLGRSSHNTDRLAVPLANQTFASPTLAGALTGGGMETVEFVIQTDHDFIVAFASNCIDF